MFSKSIPAFAGLVFFAFTISAPAQSSGAAGTIDGLVTDPAGSVIPGAQVELNNQLTGYHRATSPTLPARSTSSTSRRIPTRLRSPPPGSP